MPGAVREFVTAASMAESANDAPGRREDYWAEVAEHANVRVSSAAGAVGDAAQLEEGSELFRMGTAVARGFGLAYHYGRQGWPDRARPAGEEAEAGLEAWLARIRSERPVSARTMVATRNLARGHTVFDGAGNVTLAVG